MKTLFFPGWATSPEIFEPYYRDLQPDSFMAMDFGYFSDRSGIAGLKPTETAACLPDERCVIVGVSMGSLHALHAAALFPERVAGVLIVSGFARFLEDEGYPAQAKTALETMRAQLAEKPRALLGGFYRSLAYPSKIYFKVPDTLNLERLDEGLRLLGELDMRALLTNIGCPVSIVHGGRDKIVSRFCAEFLAERISCANLTIFDDAGHGVLATHAAECQKLLEDFVGRRPQNPF